jgi:hypothetical protein
MDTEESKGTETQESKGTDTQVSKGTDSQVPKGADSQVPKGTDSQASKDADTQGFCGCLVVIVIIAIGLALFFFFYDNDDGDDKPLPQGAQVSDSTVNYKDSLLAYFHEGLDSYSQEGLNLQEQINIEIYKFTKHSCHIYITVPAEYGKVGAADVVGKSICTLTVYWLSEKNFDIGSDGISIFCQVQSPYPGITNKPGIVTIWGYARYKPDVDSVEWEWAKKE